MTFDASVLAALGIMAGASPAGKTKPLPGTRATMPRTLWFLIAVSQPGPPPCECVNRIDGPMRSISADMASAITPAS